MTKEDKDLLLKDLCARLPYGIKVLVYGEKYFNEEKENYIEELTPCSYLFDSEVILKPYLRPLSSMTEEEKLQLYSYYTKEMADNLNNSNLNWVIRVCVSDAFGIDWLNAHHFDYHGLIEKGLALEAPEEMYEN